MSQHIIEFLSFTTLLVLKQKFSLPTSEVFDMFTEKVPLISKDISNDIALIITVCTKIIGFFFIGAFNVFMFYVINIGFHDKKSYLNIFHRGYEFILMILCDLFTLHYIEIFLSEHSRIIFKSILFAFLFVIFLFHSLFNISKYERKAFIDVFVDIIHSFILISIIFEVLIGVKKCELTMYQVIVFLILKIFIPVLIYIAFSHFRYRYILHLSHQILFDQIDAHNLHKAIEVYRCVSDSQGEMRK